MATWRVGPARPLAVASLGERYRRYRWSDVAAEEALARSLRRYGQLAPIVVCVRGDQPEVLDGFKRRAAAQLTPGLTTLSAVEVEVDERAAKAAILGLNQATQPLKLWEEAWIVQALVREDGLSQVEAAALLGRHKSWVSRRLALVERLAEPLQEDVRLGLLAAGLARQLVRLPAGNQTALLTAVRREQLNAQEARLLVDLLHGAAPEQEQFVLAQPREALRQAAGSRYPARDPRLSLAGNWVARHLARLLEGWSRLEAWLGHPGKYELQRWDRELLQSRFQRLAAEARRVASLIEDTWVERDERRGA